MALLRNRLLICLAVLALPACTSVPLASMAKLSSVDMKTTAPEDIRVAYVVPHVLRVRQGDLFMDVHLRSDAGAIDVQKRLDLLLDQAPPPPIVLAAKSGNEDVHILKLRTEDVKLFRNLQKAVNDAKAAGKKGALEIKFGSNACAEKALDGPLLISAYIKTSELNDYTLLLSKANVTELAKQAGEDPKVRLCEN